METVVGILFEEKEVTYQGKKLEVYKAIEVVVALEFTNTDNKKLYSLLNGKYIGYAVENVEKATGVNLIYIGVIAEIESLARKCGKADFKIWCENFYPDLNNYYLVKDSNGIKRIKDTDLLEFLAENYNFENQNSNAVIQELEKFGRVLNKKEYKASPTIGRERELRNLLVSLCADEKMPLLVGESGVGKTAIVEELAFRIQTGQVPSFLQDRIVLEIIPSEIVAGCGVVGTFEEKIKELMKLCEKYNVILFIDEIHTIYGTGKTKGNDNDFAAILKPYISRGNIKIIGATTTEEYHEYFSSDALKRRFDIVKVEEPNIQVLEQIIDKIISDYCLKNNISFEDENIKNQIVRIILSATKKSHRVYDDMVNNPDLAVSIIDKAFGSAKLDENGIITIEHFVEAFECCDRIYDSAKDKAIKELRNINNNNSYAHSPKVIEFKPRLDD